MPIWVPIVASIAASAVSAGMGAALAPDPNFPNYATATKEGVLAEWDTLALRRAIDRAYRLGETITVQGNNFVFGNAEGAVSATQPIRQGAAGKLPTPDELRADPSFKAEVERLFQIQLGRQNQYGGQGLTPLLQSQMRAGIENDLIRQRTGQEADWYPGKISSSGDATTYDFTGYGDADIMAWEAEQLAGGMLELQKELGPEILAEQMKQLQASDPEGFKTREQLYDLIQHDLETAKTAQRPVADELQRQLSKDLAAGTELTSDQAATAARFAGTAAASRGQDVDQDYVGPLGQGMAGEQRAASRHTATQGWLQSGATPEDVGYRRTQQGMANLGSFMAGRTPQAQFGQLSGAQAGPVPMHGGPALANVNPGAGAAGAQYGVNNFNAQYQAATSQSSDWFSGIGLALQGMGVAGSMGLSFKGS